MTLFDPEFIKKLEYLSLVSRQTFRGELFARRRTETRGGGIEFADHRDYFPGDDLRYLDWNVYARFGSRLIKRFEEDEDLCVYFFLDRSKSMAGGNPNKFDYARRVAAALCYIALDDLDRICVAAYDSTVREIFPLTRGKNQILGLLEFLERLTPDGPATDLAAAARDFIHRRPRRGLAVVISDLFDPRGWQGGIDELRFHQFEPFIVEIHDALEANPPLLGELELFDVETGETRRVTISENILARYQKEFAAFFDRLRRYAAERGIACAVARTETPFDELVLRMLRESAVQ